MEIIKLFFLLSIMISSTFAFRSFLKPVSTVVRTSTKNFASVTITDGVEFDTIAREWRCKWSADNDKKSLASAQQTLAIFKNQVSKIDGVKSVQRIVCGGCLDFKVIVSLPVEQFKAWEAKGFAPESEMLAALKAIPGITNIETQTYTLMPV